ncbi:uncharacterized protein CIMG_03860 [Coccidioides immitis RS]|uniref:Uncharacterized protein n=1 Tax=Coccidioides immitis (strain RS) TaxID=246410 RepID=J3KCA0_COCIM|nr:uncharacterized protein CIMG_03860 [Coccidioides immitis RS]EAS32836.3 hypothetical protein CIMG_03860 [Coccidioides immitis RS]
MKAEKRVRDQDAASGVHKQCKKGDKISTCVGGWTGSLPTGESPVLLSGRCRDPKNGKFPFPVRDTELPRISTSLTASSRQGVEIRLSKGRDKHCSVRLSNLAVHCICL